MGPKYLPLSRRACALEKIRRTRVDLPRSCGATMQSVAARARQSLSAALALANHARVGGDRRLHFVRATVLDLPGAAARAAANPCPLPLARAVSHVQRLRFVPSHDADAAGDRAGRQQ